LPDPTLPFDRICVTGGSGLLGRFVVRELARDAVVTVLDQKAPEPCHAFAEADVLDIGAVRRALAGQQAVVHLAARDAGTTEIEEDYLRVNVQGTWNVLQAAEELGIARVVVCSSVAAVGLGQDNPALYLPIDADHPSTPVSAYGISKLALEVLARGMAERGRLEVICLRPCLVAQAEIVWSMGQKAAEQDGREPLPPADGPGWRELREALSPTRAFVSPVDVARAFRAALAAPGLRFGIFFVTAADTCTRLPTVEAVTRGFGHAPELRQAAVYADNPCASAYDIATTRDVLGWEPRDTWSAYLDRTIAAGRRP
jgi:nucleoside-diphosphate-sugar epimerase